MRLLLTSPTLFESLQSGVDLAANLTVIGGAIGFVLAFWALVRGA